VRFRYGNEADGVALALRTLCGAGDALPQIDDVVADRVHITIANGVAV
jgi:hypothetical protein